MPTTSQFSRGLCHCHHILHTSPYVKFQFPLCCIFHLFKAVTLINTQSPDGNVPWLGGLSPDYTYAFQSVLRDIPDMAETRVTVDGLKNWLECGTADVALAKCSGDVVVSDTAGIRDGV